MNKIGKPLARVTKKKRNMNKIRNEKGNITTDEAELETSTLTTLHFVWIHKLDNSFFFFSIYFY